MTRTPRGEAACMLALLACFAVLCLASMRHMTQTTDEGAYFRMGVLALEGGIDAPDMQRMPVCAVNAAFSGLWGAHDIADARALFLARIPTVLAGMLLGLYVMRWARALYGLPGMLVSGALFAFCPDTIAHSRLVTSDVPCELFLFMAVYHLVAYLKHGRLRDGLLLVAACGLALVSKQTALLLGVIVPCIVLVHGLQGGPVRERFGPMRTLLWLGGVLLIVNAAYGFKFFTLTTSLGAVPLPVPRVYVEALLLGMLYNTGILPIDSYLLGQTSRTGWWYYFPVLFALKVPAAFLCLLAVRAAAWRPGAAWRGLDAWAWAVAVGALMLFLTAGCRVQLGIRYMLPVFPFLFVAAGKLGGCLGGGGAPWRRGALVLCLAWHAGSSLSYHPHYIAYGSDFLRDRTLLYRYFADSNLDWGQSGHSLQHYIALHAPGNDRLFVNPERPVNGTVLVNANALLGLLWLDKGRYDWLRERFEPVGNVAFNWLVFETSGVDEHGRNQGDRPDGR